MKRSTAKTERDRNLVDELRGQKVLIDRIARNIEKDCVSEHDIQEMMTIIHFFIDEIPGLTRKTEMK